MQTEGLHIRQGISCLLFWQTFSEFQPWKSMSYLRTEREKCWKFYWASAWDFQQCGMWDQQSLRSACAYAQSDQSLCWSLDYSMNIKLLTEHQLKRRLHRLVWVYTCQNATLLEITCHGSGLQIRVRTRKLFFLILNQNICCGYSKEPSHWDGSFEHPKHMFKLMGKKTITILNS